MCMHEGNCLNANKDCKSIEIVGEPGCMVCKTCEGGGLYEIGGYEIICNKCKDGVAREIASLESMIPAQEKWLATCRERLKSLSGTN